MQGKTDQGQRPPPEAGFGQFAQAAPKGETDPHSQDNGPCDEQHGYSVFASNRRGCARRVAVWAPMPTSRLETFSDGVFAIAATLLILDVQATGSPLAHELLRIWPSYLAYAISFLTIGIIWVNHHTVMGQVGRVDRTYLFLTVGFLMAVAFLPFPTRLVAEHLRGTGAKAAALAYGITMTTTAVFFQGVWFYAAIGRRLLREDADRRVVAGISRSYIPGPFLYLGATLIALASPTVSVILFGAIALFYVLESSLFARGQG